VPEVIERAMRVAGESDVLLAIGSSLQVYPVAGAVPAAKSAGARVVILNAQETPFDDMPTRCCRARSARSCRKSAVQWRQPISLGSKQ
jgi:NAD-dependent deacetylase